MGQTQIKRDDLGAGSDLLVREKHYSDQLLEDVQGKKVRYEGCVFSYAIIKRGYFFKATFVDCKFIGTRFINCVFRSATFERCDFSYADFDRCVVPIPQLLANLPSYPNVRWELLHNLRANAKSVGDTRNEADIVWREIGTEIEHWRAVSLQSSGYYEKYRWQDRFMARLRYWRLMSERHFWGHGESLVRLGAATFGCLILLSLANALGRLGSLESVSVGSLMRQWVDSFFFLAALFVDVPHSSINAKEVAGSAITSTLAVVLRYFSIGLAVPVLYKYIAKR